MFFCFQPDGLGACAQESGRSVMEIGSDLSNGERACAKQKKVMVGDAEKRVLVGIPPTNRSSASIEEAEEPERNFVVACHLDVVACKDGVCSRLDAAQAVADADFR